MRRELRREKGERERVEGEGDTKAMFPSSIESTDEHTPLLRPPERRSERPRYESNPNTTISRFHLMSFGKNENSP